MARKEETPPAVSQEDAAQVQRLLRQFHKVANNLHTSTSQNEAETALADVINLPEAAQLALLKALSKERDADAADMLLAINELSPDKAIRKEARRSLIRLQEAPIYPKWNPPIDRSLAIQSSANPPRLWKGVVTNTFDSGEAQLLLCWEQAVVKRQPSILDSNLVVLHDAC